MYKVGMSTFSQPLNRELFAKYREGGIDAIELSVKYDTIMDQDFKQIKSLSQEYNVDLWSYHLPFQPYGVMDISLPHTYKSTIDYFTEIIKRVSDIGVDKFVVHPSGEPITDEDRPELMKCAKNSLAELSVIAKKCGATIAVEDLPRTCLGKNSAEIKELISLNDDLRVCFDTNHLLSENAVDFINELKDKIITVHVSDYDFVNERHWLPGEGVLDWQGILKALQSVGYNGIWMYEIGFKCPNTISRSRDLTCADFKRNATEIFENRPISIIK